MFSGTGQTTKLEPVKHGAKTLPNLDVGCGPQEGNFCGSQRNGENASPNNLTVHRTMATTSKPRKSSAVQTPLETYCGKSTKRLC